MRTSAFLNGFASLMTAFLVSGVAVCGESGGGSGTGACGGGGSSSVSRDGSGGATGDSVTVSWDVPAESSDGGSLTDLAGYRVYDGTSPGAYGVVTEVGNVTEAILKSYPEGAYDLAVVACDEAGNESEVSNEVVVTLGEEESAPAVASAR